MLSENVADTSVYVLGDVFRVEKRRRAGVILRSVIVSSRAGDAGDYDVLFAAGRREEAGDRRVASAAWLTAFAMCVPIAGTFLWAMFDSKSFDRFVRRRNRKEYNGYWRKYEWFQGILGFVDDSYEIRFKF